ncbi:DUF5011 domain-containing protein [Pedobacter sp. B4-66]|uniref:DUF5011 domain-containing protein n=1 Tax=Pedobacter sp. B4-66 TaxID=2817280 RepID=UPI001BD9BD2D|nr:DUF5011 domain-containing protein [Pedobacter sp. B4-66]
MKKYLNIIAIGILCMTLFSCKKESFNYPEGTVGSSKITVYPILTLKSDRFVAVPVGGTYTEAGADATIADAPVEVKIGGTVNAAAAGVYLLTYTATNSDGFSATLLRTVVVYDTKADAVGNDFSGSYLREATGEISEWTKIAPGVYVVSNPGGAAGAGGIEVAVINPTGFTISMPDQKNETGSWGANSESYRSDGKQYSWAVENATYGKQLRTFVKQ